MIDYISPHFRAAEFVCHCGASDCAAQDIEMSRYLIGALEHLRGRLGDMPITITSGVRCAAHNSAVGGVANSYHLTGHAADVVVSGATPAEVAQAVGDMRGIKVIAYNDYCHIQSTD